MVPKSSVSSVLICLKGVWEDAHGPKYSGHIAVPALIIGDKDSLSLDLGTYRAKIQWCISVPKCESEVVWGAGLMRSG